MHTDLIEKEYKNDNNYKLGDYIKYFRKDNNKTGYGILLKINDPYIIINNTLIGRVLRLKKENYYIWYKDHVTSQRKYMNKILKYINKK
jgi:hypothetical protein